MKIFPKKYNPQELHNRSKEYSKHKNYKDEISYIFSPGKLPISEKLSYQDFFELYTRDFFDHINNNKNKDSLFQQLFITSNNQLKNIYSGYEFFNKKNQSIEQVGINKFTRRIISTSQKNLNANNKIVESYLSSPHKIFIPDSDLYLYILQKFHSLRETGKIIHEKKIGYRSFKIQTSIPTEHILRKEEKRPHYILKYFVGAKCEALPVCLDDIDLCCGDVALLVHPKDKRYNKYIGKNAIIPLCNRQIPIIGDNNVNITLNNGIQRVCPCSDQESIAIAEKYGLPTNIYVFDQQGLYTEFIHEPAFIGQKREKYYNNIEGFISDIGNLERKYEKLVKRPYLDHIDEYLTPYKVDQITLKLEEEKKVILEKIFNHNLCFSFINHEFGDTLNEIDFIKEKIKNLNNSEGIENNENSPNYENNTLEDLNNQIEQLKEKISNKINKYLPDSLICNSQLPYGRKIPLINDGNGNILLFNLEEDCKKRKEKPLQFCFNFIILSLVRIGILGKKISLPENNKIKLCEYDKFIRIISENEKKIQYFIKYLCTITGDKPEYEKFYQIIQNITDEDNSSKNNYSKLIKDCTFLQQEGNWLFLNIKGIPNDTIDQNFIQLCIPCYLHDKNIQINDQIIFKENERLKIFQELLVQEALLGKTISNNFLEIHYDKNNEFLGDKQLTKLQLEQSQRNLFNLYGENPIRLNFLIDKTYDQKQIILNNFFLKQIWNAIRLCIQKDFLPTDISKILNKPPVDLEDLDIGILNNLNYLYDSRKEIENYDQYIKFFIKFKGCIQDLFFSWYLEFQKIKPSKNVQFICSYFFNFLLTILYPLTPEFVEAIQYVSKKDFLFPINHIQLDKPINYDIHLIYDTFIKIKNIKIECGIKQHESCNIFIKSNPTTCELFVQYEQIFINYFHASDITYLRLHEATPLGYEVFSDETITIGIQPGDNINIKEKDSLDNIEKEIKNLDDKLNLLRQRIQLLPEGEQRTKAEEEYTKTKEEMENLTIKHSLLSNK